MTNEKDHVFQINSIFKSIQFEGMNAGTPALFIRFATCNLACPWCDTNKETIFELTTQELNALITRCTEPLIVLTGGEPTIQPVDKLALVTHIAIETNGTRPEILRSLVECGVWITFSPKAMYNWETMYEDTWALASEVKIIHSTLNKEILARAEQWHKETKRPLYLQPIETNEGIQWEEAIQYVMKHPCWRLSTQTHKLLGMP